MDDNFKGYTDVNKALQMIIDLTGDLGGGNSLPEKLQRLLDLPCEYCNDGELIKTQQVKIDRLTVLLSNSLKIYEEQSGESVMKTDLEEEIGITREEYDEVMGINHDNTDLNVKYDSDKFIYAVAVECVKGGKEFYDEYEPESQRWEDIVAKYESEKKVLIKEIYEEYGTDESQEWMINGYQPITQFKFDNGDWCEIYIMASEK
ncbi:MAG: hypothetical protein HFE32_00425 [Clostridia bacterium]|jgi:hypothetical protein|nr:hypothetical protein [Clostridia bacterium]